MTEPSKVIKSTVTLSKGTKETASAGFAVLLAVVLATKISEKLGLTHDQAVIIFTALISGAFKMFRNLLSEVLRRYGVDPNILS